MKENSEKHTREEICDYFSSNHPRTSILSKVHDMGLKYSNSRVMHFKHSSFLQEIDSPEKAWWLGWFHADGHLDIKHSHIRFQLIDKEPLEIFNSIFSYNVPIYKREVKLPNRNDTFSWVICSPSISRDLQRFGYDNHKTFTANFPPIKEKLYFHFIRGLIEGDGHLRVRICPHLKFEVSVCGNVQTLSIIKDFLGLKTKIYQKRNVCVLTANCSNAVRILHKVYANSQGLRLTRKYDIFINYLKSRDLLTPELELSFNSNSLI